ncbi:MAG: hypothetical protein CSB23_01025 [Deltaproteobacteria bacterium]|nr:MAG: hypothetical protein CSB23_01025 [Deltaproteobacteria bacterium]
MILIGQGAVLTELRAAKFQIPARLAMSSILFPGKRTVITDCRYDDQPGLHIHATCNLSSTVRGKSKKPPGH